ncbi:alpha/beta hydrolase [Pistricoccus aurantiacus]|uniref:Alpha/beta hydrolase n=1 Tax=Pistricoccus aurantiacus TaxID=1883414 RepID=A0A5B8SM11_9GAMM|nr:alpha/beta hydrolase fold domain-containing protein [Pistricoccus aurantiacus]QEA38172.1 alpha/beta hydrolase [Pistricoccus aurantiacus]
MDIDTFIRRFEAGLATLGGVSIEEARRRYDTICASFAPADPAGMRIHDDQVEGVPVRRFLPGSPQRGCVVYCHGGGWNLGSTISHHGVAASLAQQLGREVVSVDYRLAPEASYRDALEDCRRVVVVCAPHALVGDSAGARLAMDVAYGGDWQGPLGLIYPPVGKPSVKALGPDAPLLSRVDILTLWRQVADQLPDIPVDTPPASRMDVLAVEHDPLTRPLFNAVDDWRAFGAEVSYRVAPDMVHGALHAWASLPAMGDAWQEFCEALRVRLS